MLEEKSWEEEKTKKKNEHISNPKLASLDIPIKVYRDSYTKASSRYNAKTTR